jgi:protein-disulfide isomerase
MLRFGMDTHLRPFTNVSDRFEVERAIGRSGAGELWVARDRTEGRSVVLEAIASERATDPDAVDAFVAEVTTGRPSNAPGIADVLGAGADAAAGILWVAYAPFEGQSLRMRLERGTPPPRETLSIVDRILRALAPAHDAGLVHRGLDPDDVWLVRETDGRDAIRILDFGFARHLAAPRHSPYVSPEQARQSAWITPAADTYSVGVLFYEMVAGAPPPVESPVPSLSEVSPGTPPAIAALVASAISPDPGLRPPNARAMAGALERIFAPPADTRSAPQGSATTPLGDDRGVNPGGLASSGGAGAATPGTGFGAARARVAYAEAARVRSPAVSGSVAPRKSSAIPWVIGLVVLLGGCLLAPALVVVGAALFVSREASSVPSYDPYGEGFDDDVDDAYGDEPVVRPSGVADLRPLDPSRPGFDGDGVHRVRLPVTADQPRLGPDDALVTIVMFSDFECPFCARARITLEQVRANYGDDVRLVWRDNPLPFHRNADAAAQLAREARAQQGDAGFWRMHDTLFANQRALTPPDLERYAAEQGLRASEARSAIASRRYSTIIAADQAAAARAGALGTPTFFVNGRKLAGAQPYERFRELIEEELATARSMVARGTARSAVYDQLMARASDGPAPEPAPTPRPPPSFGDDDADRVYAIPSRLGAPTRGPQGAAVTIEIFSDFQCPFCNRVRPTLDALLRDNPGRVRLVWRNYPLSFHQDAFLAAEAALEAHAQGGDAKFWEYHDKLFDNQRALTRPDLERYAAEVGLDLPRFRRALDAHVHASAVREDMRAVDTSGASIGTPSFFINGRLLQGAQPLSAFQAAVDAAPVRR